MESKTIRFEKEEWYELDNIPNGFSESFYTTFFDTTTTRDAPNDDLMWCCIKSFTVQINIIEDENN